jgi:hypothetical protein
MKAFISGKLPGYSKMAYFQNVPFLGQISPNLSISWTTNKIDNRTV